MYPWDQLKTTFELNESSNLVEIEEPVGLAIAEVSRSRGQVQVRVVACEFEPPRAEAHCDDGSMHDIHHIRNA